MAEIKLSKKDFLGCGRQSLPIPKTLERMIPADAEITNISILDKTSEIENDFKDEELKFTLRGEEEFVYEKFFKSLIPILSHSH